MSGFYGEYKSRINRIAAKLPKDWTVTITFAAAPKKKRRMMISDLKAELCRSQREGREKVIAWIDPIDLAVIREQDRLLTYLLTFDGYYAASPVVIWDKRTGKLRELSEKNYEAMKLDDKLKEAPPDEQEEYWSNTEDAFKKRYGNNTP